MTRILASLLAVAALACAAREGGGSPARAEAPAAAPEADGAGALPGVPREQLNRSALELGLPLHWTEDRNGDARLDPDELAVIWGLDARPRDHWVKDGAFTPALREAFERIRAHVAAPGGAADPRQAALRQELSQSYFTVIESDFASAPEEERAVVRHVLAAAGHVERLYAKQLGTHALEARVPATDGLARTVFFLNQGPWCSGPATQDDPRCSAIAPPPPRISGLYPPDLQAKPGFCEALANDPAADRLTNPFTAVRRDASGKLVAVPYPEAFPEEMGAIARELDAAAAAIRSPGEAAMKAYLTAAAKAFRDNDWFAADEAWARMNAQNSRWFLRVGPDEVYYEPCNLKAGFHVSFARINDASLAWQRRLEPVKSDMEKALAALAGAPYQARAVSFHLPDFIDVILNAGDSRDPRGATIGQSLPNWGPVANEGRGRTVAMTNLYLDPESKRVARERAASLLCPETMARYADDADSTVMGTVLHEAAHNLGPSAEYRVKGRTDDQIFGGPLASTLEELKAQTSALYLTDWLVEKGAVDRDLAERAHVRDITWTFGHISRGMYDAEGKIKPYSALSAIQVGFLVREGALAWRADATAANGKDRGCFAIDFAAMPAAVTKLEQLALGIKARGDLAAANALVQGFVAAGNPNAALLDTITERVRRHPTATFLYAVRP